MDKYERRYRYSLAHEVGHMILHSEIYKQLKFVSADQWKNIMEKFPSNEYGWIEKHAYDFAGLILVPDNHLEERYKINLTRIEKAGYSTEDFDKEILIDFIVPSLSKDFNVSDSVIRRRLKYNDLNT
jgi:Zn-dependent peptidase ImmA (M78 family)